MKQRYVLVRTPYVRRLLVVVVTRACCMLCVGWPSAQGCGGGSPLPVERARPVGSDDDVGAGVVLRLDAPPCVVLEPPRRVLESYVVAQPDASQLAISVTGGSPIEFACVEPEIMAFRRVAGKLVPCETDDPFERVLTDACEMDSFHRLPFEMRGLGWLSVNQVCPAPGCYTFVAVLRTAAIARLFFWALAYPQVVATSQHWYRAVNWAPEYWATRRSISEMERVEIPLTVTDSWFPREAVWGMDLAPGEISMAVSNPVRVCFVTAAQDCDDPPEGIIRDRLHRDSE